MGTHPSERGVRSNPDGPANPAKRTHLEEAARFVGLAGATAIGAGIGFVVVGGKDQAEIQRTVDDVYPSVPRDVARSVEKEVTVFEIRAAEEVRAAVKRGDPNVVIPIPPDLVQRSSEIKSQSDMHSGVVRQMDELVRATKKVYGGTISVLTGFIGIMISLASQRIAEIRKEDQAARATVIPQV